MEFDTFLNYIFIYTVCVYVSMFVCHSVFGSQRTTYRSQLSLSIIWVLGIDLRLSDTFTCGATLPASPSFFLCKRVIEMLFKFSGKGSIASRKCL